MPVRRQAAEPLDMIKVDLSFVQGAETDAKDAAITANIINLAHALGLRAVAEGIETDGQLSSMRGLGCDLAQGYHFARPMPPHQLSELLPASSAESQDHDARANAA